MEPGPEKGVGSWPRQQACIHEKGIGCLSEGPKGRSCDHKYQNCEGAFALPSPEVCRHSRVPIPTREEHLPLLLSIYAIKRPYAPLYRLTIRIRTCACCRAPENHRTSLRTSRCKTKTCTKIKRQVFARSYIIHNASFRQKCNRSRNHINWTSSLNNLTQPHNFAQFSATRSSRSFFLLFSSPKSRCVARFRSTVWRGLCRILSSFV